MQVAISGGGIGGLAAGIALRRLDHEVHVFERRPAPSTIGAGIVCWPNAMFVLDGLGVRGRVEDAGGRPRVMRRLSSSGEDLGALPLAEIEERLGHPSVSILRADLHAILLARFLELGGRISHGEEVLGVSQEGERAVLHFASATSRSADLAIGADGRMASRFRRHLQGDATPRYQGFVNWIGVVHFAAPRLDPAEILDVWGVGTRFGLVPLSDRRAYWAAGRARAASEPAAVSSRADLIRLFEPFPPIVTAVLEESRDERIREIAVHDHEPDARWCRGRIVMLGDAAHAPLPTSGQGACQALEDAFHLASALAPLGERPSPEALDAALQHFVGARFDKTTRITMSGRAFARRVFDTDPDRCAQRDQQSRREDVRASARAMATLWGQGLPQASA